MPSVSTLLGQAEKKAAVDERRPADLPQRVRQSNAPLEGAVGYFQAEDRRAARHCRQSPHAGDEQYPALERDLRCPAVRPPEAPQQSSVPARPRTRRPAAPSSQPTRPRGRAGRTGDAVAPPVRSSRRLPPTSSSWDRPQSWNPPRTGLEFRPTLTYSAHPNIASSACSRRAPYKGDDRAATAVRPFCPLRRQFST